MRRVSRAGARRTGFNPTFFYSQYPPKNQIEKYLSQSHKAAKHYQQNPRIRTDLTDLPPELPTGKAKIEYTITPESPLRGVPEKSLRSLLGIHKGLDTMDAYFARKRADKAQEDSLFERMRSKR